MNVIYMSTAFYMKWNCLEKKRRHSMSFENKVTDAHGTVSFQKLIKMNEELSVGSNVFLSVANGNLRLIEHAQRNPIYRYLCHNAADFAVEMSFYFRYEALLLLSLK